VLGVGIQAEAHETEIDVEDIATLNDHGAVF
jgi:hypothetical protein